MNNYVDFVKQTTSEPSLNYGAMASRLAVFHMKRELGDICWYLAQAFMALDTNFDEILDMNIEKLSARYPAGTFDSYYSENRVEGDV